MPPDTRADILDMSIDELGGGNPGATTAIFCILRESGPFALKIFLKILKCRIKGGDLYIFWNDLANRSVSNMISICDNVPDDVLIKACARQDYKGRDMIKPYVNAEVPA